MPPMQFCAGDGSVCSSASLQVLIHVVLGVACCLFYLFKNWLLYLIDFVIFILRGLLRLFHDWLLGVSFPCFFHVSKWVQACWCAQLCMSVMSAMCTGVHVCQKNALTNRDQHLMYTCTIGASRSRHNSKRQDAKAYLLQLPKDGFVWSECCSGCVRVWVHLCACARVFVCLGACSSYLSHAMFQLEVGGTWQFLCIHTRTRTCNLPPTHPSTHPPTCPQADTHLYKRAHTYAHRYTHSRANSHIHTYTHKGTKCDSDLSQYYKCRH